MLIESSKLKEILEDLKVVDKGKIIKECFNMGVDTAIKVIEIIEAANKKVT